MTQGNQGWTQIPPKRLAYDLTCVYIEPQDEMPDLWPGYKYLDKFDMVVYRLGIHELTAIQLPQGADFARCEADLPTMRLVPLDPSVVWLRRNKVTGLLLQVWREGEDDWGLALLRAVYLVRPLLYLFPAQCWEEHCYIHEGYALWAARDQNDWAVGVFSGDQMVWRSPGNAYLTRDAAIAGAVEWVDSTRKE